VQSGLVANEEQPHQSADPRVAAALDPSARGSQAGHRATRRGVVAPYPRQRPAHGGGIGREPANLSLLQAAGTADLLIVRSRGYGGWKDLLTGSVSAQCVTQSPCPVAVVRDGNGDTALLSE
jgi:nucleotide-binding universal stress UspA family protein